MLRGILAHCRVWHSSQPSKLLLPLERMHMANREAREAGKLGQRRAGRLDNEEE